MRGALRTPLVAVSVVALLVFGSATAYAVWSTAGAVRSAASVSSGTIGLAATWVTTPNLTAMAPGQSRSGIARLVHSGNGKWQYRLPSLTGAEAMPGLSVAYTSTNGAPGTCTTTPIAAGSWSATQPNGSTVYVCVTATLAATASSSAQGVTPSVSIAVEAQNQPTN